MQQLNTAKAGNNMVTLQLSTDEDVLHTEFMVNTRATLAWLKEFAAQTQQIPIKGLQGHYFSYYVKAQRCGHGRCKSS